MIPSFTLLPFNPSVDDGLNFLGLCGVAQKVGSCHGRLNQPPDFVKGKAVGRVDTELRDGVHGGMERLIVRVFVLQDGDPAAE